MDTVIKKRVVEVFLKVSVCQKISTCHRHLQDGHVFNSNIQQNEGVPVYVQVYQEESEGVVPYPDSSVEVPTVADLLSKCSQDLKPVLRNLLQHACPPHLSCRKQDVEAVQVSLCQEQCSDAESVCVQQSRPPSLDDNSSSLGFGAVQPPAVTGHRKDDSRLSTPLRCKAVSDRGSRCVESPRNMDQASTKRSIPADEEQSSGNSCYSGCSSNSRRGGNAQCGKDDDGVSSKFPHPDGWPDPQNAAAFLEQSCGDSYSSAGISSIPVSVHESLKKEPLSDDDCLTSADDDLDKKFDPVTEGSESQSKDLTACVSCGQICQDTVGLDHPVCAVCLQIGRLEDNDSDIQGEPNGADGPFTCSLCTRSYASRNALLKHKRVRHADRCHSCPVCHKMFAERKYMELHQRWHSQLQSVELPFCSLCNASFTTSVALKRHVDRRTCQKTRRCAICGHSFSHAGALKVHMQSHRGAVAVGVPQTLDHQHLVCEMCGKTFAGISSLNKHRRKHQGESPHQCGECGRTFFEAFQLKVHQRTHSGERPFLCCFCGKTFSQRAHLQRHMKLHGGQPHHLLQSADTSTEGNHCPDYGDNSA